MKLTEQQQKEQKFLANIYQKAWNDENFKKELINNPIETLNKFTGKTASLPKYKKIIINDQTNTDYIYINIPSQPNFEDIELSEDQLEKMAGGYSLNELNADVYSFIHSVRKTLSIRSWFEE